MKQTIEECIEWAVSNAHSALLWNRCDCIDSAKSSVEKAVRALNLALIYIEKPLACDQGKNT